LAVRAVDSLKSVMEVDRVVCGVVLQDAGDNDTAPFSFRLKVMLLLGRSHTNKPNRLLYLNH